jgi:hypothetical protein
MQTIYAVIETFFAFSQNNFCVYIGSQPVNSPPIPPRSPENPVTLYGWVM